MNYPYSLMARDGRSDLCGEWDFELFQPDTDISDIVPSKKINVPFPAGHICSSVDTPCEYGAYYMRKFKLGRCPSIGKTFLRFEKIQGRAIIYVNGKKVAEHNSPGSLDVCAGNALKCGENRLEILVYGKGAGICGNAIVESVFDNYIEEVKLLRKDNKPMLVGKTSNPGDVELMVFGVCTDVIKTDENGNFSRELEAPSDSTWQEGKGGLLDVMLKFGDDVVITYFGVADNDTSTACGVFEEYPYGGYLAKTDEEAQGHISHIISSGITKVKIPPEYISEQLVYYSDKLGLKIETDLNISHVI